MNLVREQMDIGLRLNVAHVLRFLHGTAQGGDPLVHDGGDTIAHGSAAVIEFKGRRGEKTSAFEETALDVTQPEVQKVQEARHAFGRAHRRTRNLIDKKLPGGFDGSQLQVLFGTKVREEAAFAHVELLREAADGEAFETFDGGDVHGAAENSVAGAQSAGLAADQEFGRVAGMVKRARHEGIVTQK